MADFTSLIKVKNSSNGFDTIFPITKASNIVVDEQTDKRLSTKLSEIDSEIGAKVDSSEKGVANGIATLDANGLVPLTQLPAQVKEMRVVDTIVDRDALAPLFAGLTALVKDASDDVTVSSGAAYYTYDGTSWFKTAEAESLDAIVDWADIQGKPSTLSGYGITDAVNSSEVSLTAEANKLIKTNAEGKMPVSITGNSDGNAATATALQTSRNISISGAATGTVSFDGTSDVDIAITLANSGVVAGTYTKVTVDAKGRVTVGDTLIASDIPALDWTKITTGKPTTLDGYGITDGVNKTGDTMTGFLTLNEDPTSPMHAATKQYVDNAVQGLDVKANVRVATTENIILSGLQSIDGVLVVEGNRVLVKDQTNPVENGVYVASAGAWVRSSDFDDQPDTEVTGGEFVFVSEGTVNSDNGFVVVTDEPVVVGTSEIIFAQFSGAGQVIAGVGLSKNGNTLYLSNTGVVTGTYSKVTVDAQGRVTVGDSLIASDIPDLDWSKITTGKPTSAVADIDDAVANRHTHANKAILDLFTDPTSERLVYNSREIAYKDEANNTVLSAEEPASLPVNGIWFQTV